MSTTNSEALRLCHTGGIVDAWTMPRANAEGVIRRLMTCTAHGGSHVFVVDQSHVDSITIGVSEHGTDCIRHLL